MTDGELWDRERLRDELRLVVEIRQHKTERYDYIVELTDLNSKYSQHLDAEEPAGYQSEYWFYSEEQLVNPVTYARIIEYLTQRLLCNHYYDKLLTERNIANKPKPQQYVQLSLFNQ